GLWHGIIPPHLHFRTPNPRLSLEAVRIPTEPLIWERHARPRRAGVSSFGFGGTNVHVVLEEAPQAAPAPPDETQSWVLPISAHSVPALTALATAYAERLAADMPSALANVCATAARGRDHMARRIAVVGATADEMAAQLRERVAQPL